MKKQNNIINLEEARRKRNLAPVEVRMLKAVAGGNTVEIEEPEIWFMNRGRSRR